MSTFNLNGITDAIQRRIEESHNPQLKEANKVLVAELSGMYQPQITTHQLAIKELKAEDNGNVVNAKAIKYHESKLDYYMS